MNKIKVEVRDSLIEGKGLFAIQPISKGTKIADYHGEEMPYELYKKTYPNGLDKYYYKGRNLFVIVSNEEPYLSSNLINFVNEGKDPNSCLKKRALYAIRHIEQDEEILLSYPKSYKRSWPDPNRSK